ncbi:MAG: LysR family transcriptional regulator [Zoogloea sp.]|nr:LysR family transcriptional regulator [Zoogloea sp.]MBP7395021.1 LysR family transcriptional regulator [Zoogloea sp.]
MNIKPQLEDLRLFCVVVRKRSFAATARELGVSKAVVSKRIALLEDALQDRLLHRTTRSVSLTAQGEIVHQWAQRILEDVDLMGDALAHEKATPRGLLRICSSTGFGRNRLAPALSELARRYPALEIQVELLDRAVDLVEEGFQLDIRIGHVHEGQVIKRRIAENRRILCASPAYLARFGTPQSLDDLKAHRCIAIRERDQDFGRWDLSGPDGLASIKVSGPLSANNGEIVRQWAIDGHGVILRSGWDVGREIDAGVLKHVLPQYFQQADVWAVYPSRLSASAKVKVCVEFLAGWFTS